MAHKKSGGVAQGNRDSTGKRLGIKLYGGQKAAPGQILVRQVGNKFYAGVGAKIGRDFTIFTLTHGVVKFGKRFGKKIVSVV